MDKIDEKLGRLCLRWHRTSGEPKTFSAEKVYGLVSIGVIRSIVNLVLRSTMHCVTGETKVRAVRHFSMCDVVDGWEHLSFYVN